MERLKINVDLNKSVLENRKKMFLEIKDDSRIINFLKKYHLDETYLAENIQKFYDWLSQLDLSQKCESSEVCLLENRGYYFDLKYDDGILVRELKPCAHQIAYDKQMYFLDNYLIKDFPDSLVKIRIKEILKKDESEEYMKLVVKVASFLNKPSGAGYYIFGAVGVGKTYLLSAITNELARQNFKIAFVHTPTLANNLRSQISENHSLDQTLYNLKNIDILVLDDIGSEIVTNWFRDDILLSILNYRMEAKKTTFFTSNLSVEELLEHYAINNRREYNKLSAQRLIERIKTLSMEVELIGENRRSLI